jgi:hypothetical protein
MRPLFVNVIVGFASLAVAAVCGEIGLRITGFSFPNFYAHDPNTGSRLRANAEGWYSDEGNAYVRINSHGFRDHERKTEKPANVLRIAVLGDSYAEALQVPIEETFWSHLARELKQCESLGTRKVEVLNFGVSGFSTAQELLMFRHYAREYRPDIVLLSFLTGNDVRDNSKRITGGFPRPYFIYRDGQLTLDTSYRDSFVYRLKASSTWDAFGDLTNHVRVLQLVNKARHRLGQQLAAARMHKRGSNADGAEVGLDHQIYLEPATQEWKEAWTITEALVGMLNAEVSTAGGQLFLVSLSNGVQVTPNRERRESLAKSLGVTDLFYPDRRIGKAATKYGVPHLLVAPLMAKRADETGIYFHGFENTKMGGGHWNIDGHRLAGRMISDHICATLRIPAKPGL